MNVYDAISRLNSLTASPSKEEVSARNKRLSSPPGPPKLVRHPSEEFIAPIVDTFRVADAFERQAIVSSLSEISGQYVGAYAAVMAVLAVRQGSPDFVLRGLIALAIEGGGLDIRNSIPILATLHHSALKLGMDAQQTFSDIAALSPADSMRAQMTTFPSRPPEIRGLEAFYLREVMTDDGFMFEKFYSPGERAAKPSGGV
jgi:hypothetical protein